LKKKKLTHATTKTGKEAEKHTLVNLFAVLAMQSKKQSSYPDQIAEFD